MNDDYPKSKAEEDLNVIQNTIVGMYQNQGYGYLKLGNAIINPSDFSVIEASLHYV